MEAAALARRTGCVRGTSSSQPGEAGMQCVLLQCPAGVDSSIKWRRGGRCPGSTHSAALALIACYEQQSAWRGWRAVCIAAVLYWCGQQHQVAARRPLPKPDA